MKSYTVLLIASLFSFFCKGQEKDSLLYIYLNPFSNDQSELYLEFYFTGDTLYHEHTLRQARFTSQMLKKATKKGMITPGEEIIEKYGDDYIVTFIGYDKFLIRGDTLFECAGKSTLSEDSVDAIYNLIFNEKKEEKNERLWRILRENKVEVIEPIFSCKWFLGSTTKAFPLNKDCYFIILNQVYELEGTQFYHFTIINDCGKQKLLHSYIIDENFAIVGMGAYQTPEVASFRKDDQVPVEKIRCKP